MSYGLRTYWIQFNNRVSEALKVYSFPNDGMFNKFYNY